MLNNLVCSGQKIANHTVKYDTPLPSPSQNSHLQNKSQKVTFRMKCKAGLVHK